MNAIWNCFSFCGVKGPGGAASITGVQRSYKCQVHPGKPYKWEPRLQCWLVPGLGKQCPALLLPSDLPTSDTCSQTAFIKVSVVPGEFWSGAFSELQTNPAESRGPTFGTTVPGSILTFGMQGKKQ